MTGLIILLVWLVGILPATIFFSILIWKHWSGSVAAHNKKWRYSEREFGTGEQAQSVLYGFFLALVWPATILGYFGFLGVRTICISVVGSNAE